MADISLNVYLNFFSFSGIERSFSFHCYFCQMHPAKNIIIPDYKLIDCGDFEKLERFGEYHLIRPESQAIWPRRLDDKKWKNMAHAHFRRDQNKVTTRSAEPGTGGWNFYKPMPDNWVISCPLPVGTFRMKLSLTSFGHVGIFPEQAENWFYIYETIQNSKIEKPRVLNAFAYTGGASLAARIAGAEVTHLDAVKQIVNWGKENMVLNNLSDIRWIIDDAVKFLRREVKRGKKYNGIILDPPAYGRGPNGERWILDEGINEVLSLCASVLESRNSFFVLNLYSLGYSPIIANNLVESYFNFEEKDFGESFISSESGIKLPLGIFFRSRNK